MDLKGYHDRHSDLLSAGRGSIEGGIWGGRMSVEPLPDDVIEGMPGDWLERQLGEETARQARGHLLLTFFVVALLSVPVGVVCY